MNAVKVAAVVVPIVLAREPVVIFVKRAAHLRRNAGQIAFPGGLADPADAGRLRRTALRELQEELGIPGEAVELVHQLPGALVVNRSVAVTPFVGVLRSLPALAIDTSEVERVYQIPLRAIAEPGAVHEGIEHYAGLDIPTWQFDYGGVHVWGATARILHGFLEAVAENERLRARLKVSP